MQAYVRQEGLLLRPPRQSQLVRTLTCPWTCSETNTAQVLSTPVSPESCSHQRMKKVQFTVLLRQSYRNADEILGQVLHSQSMSLAVELRTCRAKVTSTAGLICEHAEVSS